MQAQMTSVFGGTCKWPEFCSVDSLSLSLIAGAHGLPDPDVGQRVERYPFLKCRWDWGRKAKNRYIVVRQLLRSISHVTMIATGSVLKAV